MERIALTAAIVDHGSVQDEWKAGFLKQHAREEPRSMTFAIGSREIEQNPKCLAEARSLASFVEETWDRIGAWLA